MAGTARLNPGSAPILPTPYPSREGLPHPAMSVGSFHIEASMEHHRALQDQRWRQQHRDLSLKRGWGFRDDMERQRAAPTQRMDRMMMMAPPHVMMAAGPCGRNFQRVRTSTVSVDGRTTDAPAGRANYGPLGIGNGLAMDGPASVGARLHRMNSPGDIGNGHRMDGPVGIVNPPSSILRMEGSSSSFFGLKVDSEVGASFGLENAADRGLENPNLIDKRLKSAAVRRSVGLENSEDQGLENTRLIDRRLESRERTLENSGVLQRRSDNSMGMEGILENPIVMERRSESSVGVERRVENCSVIERRSEAIVGMVRPSDRTVTGMEMRSEARAPIMERRSETGIQRRVESPVELERRLERRLEPIPPEPDGDRVGFRFSSVRPPSFDKGRSAELEHEDREINMDSLREVDIQMERPMDDVAMQELVAQYKMAIAELTYNSKPIITNLTIIAGENLHASKLIASTVCAHILEVPVEQKLPSLYLLDSIVKNIGNEYVKYFSARLTEVFIESYRQVDPSLHPAMHHLFKTWRGVFTMEPLRAIEEELHLNIIGNATPSSAAPISNSTGPEDSSPQQPGHSIHVNPKYLEAQRQEVQQSSQVYVSPLGGIGSIDQGNEGGGSGEEREKLWDSGWPREEDSLRPPESGSLRHGLRNEFEPPQLSPQALVDGYGNIRGMRAPRLPPAPVQPTQDLDNRLNRGLARNWQNSEEEEYSCGISRKVRDNWYPRDGYKNVTHGALSAGEPFGLDQPISDHSVWHRHGAPVPYPILETPLLGSNGHSLIAHGHSMTGHPSHSCPQQPSLPSQPKFQSLQVNRNTPPSALGSQVSFPASFSNTEQSTAAGPFSTTRVTVLQNLVSSPLPSGVLNLGSLSPVAHVSGLKQLQRPPSPLPLNSSPRLHVPPPPLTPPLHQPNLPSLHPAKTAHHRSQVRGMQPYLSQQLMPLHPPQRRTIIQQLPQQQGASVPLQNSLHGDSLSHKQANEQVSDEQPHQTVAPFPSQLLESLQHLRHHQPSLLGGLPQASKPPFPYSPPSQPVQSLQRPVLQENVLPEVSTQQLSGPQNHGPTNNLLADFLRSGLGVMPLSVQSQPPVPNAPPPLPLGSDVLPGQSAPLAVSTSTSNLCLPPAYASSGNLQPPLPPGLPPAASQVASTTTLGNNYTSLLSSLVAQGIISACPSASTLPQSVGVVPTNPGGFSAPFATIVSTTSVTALRTQEPSLKAIFAPPDTMPSDPSVTEFKQEALRERQEFVITALYSAFPRQCTTCGLRFKNQEEHSEHMDWHVSRNRRQKSSKKVSRRWFVSVKEWLNGTGGVVSEVTPAFFPEDVAVEPEEQQEVVAVPADENQIACFLCGEPFEDFYSDDAEEWMYRGAVYMNASLDGSMESLDSSSQGPIVHAKCRSESAVSTVANTGEDVELQDEDNPGSRRKRLRC